MQENVENVQKPQVLHISGGTSFNSKKQALEYYENYDIDRVFDGKFWREWLVWSLDGVFEYVTPNFPVKQNADYDIHKVIFEKYFAKLNNQPLFIIAHSLGCLFVIKYLLENGFVKKIKQLHLVGPIVTDDFQPKGDVEQTGTFTMDYSMVGEIAKYCEEIHIWHSTDDTMCMYKNAEYLKEKIPASELHTFTDRGHFLQSTFWELFDVLRSSV
jgi:predicted alpha/beta hydrolase family esterase